MGTDNYSYYHNRPISSPSDPSAASDPSGPGGLSEAKKTGLAIGGVYQMWSDAQKGDPAATEFAKGLPSTPGTFELGV